MFVGHPGVPRGSPDGCSARSKVAGGGLGYAYARLDTGPLQLMPSALRGQGYAPIAAYNANPYASFGARKGVARSDGGRG